MSRVSIGRFASMSGLSIKTLRHYDAVGVLRPAGVDLVTGYRSYALAQLREAALVTFLRDFELPLGDIAVIVADPSSPEAKLRLEQHRERLAARQRATERTLASLTRLLNEEERMPFDIDIVEREPIDAVVEPSITDSTQEAREAYRAAFRSLARRMRAAGMYRGATVAVTARDQAGEGLHGRSGWTIPPGAPVADSFERLTIPGGRYAHVRYVGNYDDQWQAFAALEEWLSESDHTPGDDYVLFFNRRIGDEESEEQANTDIFVPLVE